MTATDFRAGACGEAGARPDAAAAALLEAVRRGDTVTVQRILRRPDLPRITVMVAEFAVGPRPLRPHGTHAAFNRHRAAGEEPCADCWTAERTYKRLQARRRYRVAKSAVDAVVIARVLEGGPLPTMNRAERQAAYVALVASGVTPNQAARRLRLSGTTARRYAAKLGPETTANERTGAA